METERHKWTEPEIEETIRIYEIEAAAGDSRDRIAKLAASSPTLSASKVRAAVDAVKGLAEGGSTPKASRMLREIWNRDRASNPATIRFKRLYFQGGNLFETGIAVLQDGSLARILARTARDGEVAVDVYDLEVRDNRKRDPAE